MQVPLSSSSAPWEVPRLHFPPSHPTPIASRALHHTLTGSGDVTSRALDTWFWVQVWVRAVSTHLPQDTRTSPLTAAASLSLPATHPVSEVLRFLL